MSKELPAYLDPYESLPSAEFEQASVESRIVVLGGPSGVGKGTVVRNLVDNYPGEFTLSTSYTTRCPRPGEVDGVNYHFVDHSKFEGLICDGDLIEWAEFGGNMYGSPTPEKLASNSNGLLLFEIEIEGAQSMHHLYPGANFLYLLPPSMEELKSRLVGRSSESEEDLRLRLEIAYRELEKVAELNYFHCVPNEDIGLTVGLIRASARRHYLCRPDVGSHIAKLLR